MYWSRISCRASWRALPSRFLLTPLSATLLMSVHFEVELRPGAEFHFFLRASVSCLSGRRLRRKSVWVEVRQGSWSLRMSSRKWGSRSLILRLGRMLVRKVSVNVE